MIKSLAIAASFALLANATAHAAIRVTEVAPWSSGNSPLAVDWFEVTNTGPAAVDVTGWKVDDSSNAFASAIVLNGITSIAAGESVIYAESASSIADTFKTLWFGATPPAGLQVGNYSGTAIGLSTGGDAVNLYNSAGTLQTNVTFGASDAVAPFQTFDNSAGANNAAISLLSVAGTNGAFGISTANGGEVGSPGTAVPEPVAFGMLAPAALALLARRRRNA